MHTVTTDDEQPVACTLQGGRYEDRLAWIAELARDGLRSHERRDLVLELRYAAHVIDRVGDMVAKERDCCAFLAFNIDESADEIRLTIAVPERARDVADLLFEQFVPASIRAAMR
jgi:hypothetical protein